MGGIQRTTGVTVNAAADGDNTLIAGVAGKRITVLAYQFQDVTTAGLAIFKSGASGTEHARFTFLLGQVIPFPGGADAPAFVCDVGASLVVNNAANVDVQGHITYSID